MNAFDEKVAQALGISSAHINFDDFDVPMHAAIGDAYDVLKQHARAAGFELRAVSGFRDFQRQCLIFNEKVIGSRAVLDENEAPLQRQNFNDVSWVYAILRWSALPGASRHHWGTDFDIADYGVIKSGYQLQLTRQETSKGGAFYEMYRWLEHFLASSHNPGFFRPYRKDLGGVAPEPWHLSFAPLADDFEKCVTLENLMVLVRNSEIHSKQVVLEHLETIFARFVCNISPSVN